MHRHAFLILLLSLAHVAIATPSYTISDLGIAAAESHATSLNSQGWVAGYSFNPPGDPHAFLYAPAAELVDPGTLANSFTYAYSVNGIGQVAGSSYVVDPDTVIGPSGIPRHAHAFLGSRSAPPVDLGTLPGLDHSIARSINDAGVIVGESFHFGDGSGVVPDTRAFRYADGAMTDLGTLPGGTIASARAINNAGQIVGYSSLPAVGNSYDRHAFLFSDGVMTDLGTLGGPTSVANAISSNGLIAGGSSIVAPDGRTFARAFLYANRQMTSLGTLGGDNSFATGINASGQIVGRSDIDASHDRPFLYSGGLLTELNSLLPRDSSWILTDASAINDAGQIAGTGLLNGRYHAFLLTPAPEPSSFPSFVPLVTVILRRRRNSLDTIQTKYVHSSSC